jgi:hypothetical protein
MEKNDSFQPTGKRLDNLNKLLKSKHPNDLWVMEKIIPPFLSIIDSSSTLQQQKIVVRELKQLFDAYEFRYGTILENMNPKDTIKLDVPLFIRLLEYAREDAKTDMDLHDLAERAINLSTEGECLGMQDYDSLVGQTEKLDESFLRMQKMAGIITEEEYNNAIHVSTLKDFSEKISSGVSKIKQMLRDEGYNV